MKRLLFTTLPSNDLGLLTRSLPIANQLAKNGYDIAFSSPAKAPEKLIAEAGFKNLIPRHPLFFISFDMLSWKGLPKLFRSESIKSEFGNSFNFIIELIKSLPLKFAPASSEVWNMDHAAAMAGMMNKNFVKSHCIAMINLINELDPDAILDFWNPFACIAAKYLNKPLITIIQADAHPANPGLIWWKKPHSNIPSALPTINKVLSGFGLQTINKMENLNLGDLTLIVGTPETDPLPDGSEGEFIGPILWQNSNEQLPAWFSDLKDGKPIIWVYSGNPRYAPKGTALDSEIIISSCIEALADESVHIILTTGHHKLPKSYLPLPKNFTFASYIPGITLANKCDLLIHHGGYGSCQTGLFTGTPAVIIPTFSERESNARRIADLGAGEIVIPFTNQTGVKQIDLDDFKSKVKQVLSTNRYNENAIKLSKLLKSYGGTNQAVSLIMKFLEHR